MLWITAAAGELTGLAEAAVFFTGARARLLSLVARNQSVRQKKEAFCRRVERLKRFKMIKKTHFCTKREV